MSRILILMALILTGFQAKALDLNAPFDSIDGGTLTLSQWSGQPILVVNTASRCAFTKQYSGLQALYDTYRDRGLVVLAVPSNDFRQELSNSEKVKEFCELQYGVDMPMTGITHVKGPEAHPFFQSLKREEGFVPSWNFNKVLIGPEGDLVATYSSQMKPKSSRIRREIEGLLK
ncbi:glutathione peroxidase [Pseudophaeobacter profundi]|jgi:glutathione peroxidase|uniref:glutathione peroxidase n=1 Tax=Pseudophaeobacter profundi TaxID=3034152 RepID=UPI00242EBDB8|nr:glutathione peroxidase [Pseudophaeobacter profundi]